MQDCTHLSRFAIVSRFFPDRYISPVDSYTIIYNYDAYQDDYYFVRSSPECCPDHIHMLVAIPPHMSVSEYMGYLKSKSSLMIFDRHANLEYKYGNRHFWCRGYYVDTVGKYEGAIAEYIRNQLQEDIANDQISLKEFTDPFTGEPVK